MTSTPPSLVENVATFVRQLALAVAVRSMYGPLSSALVLFINLRLHHINRRVREVIERLQAGTYVPRRTGKRRAPATSRPRRPGPVRQKFGWLEPLLPELTPHRAQLYTLLHDPRMAEMIQAAPTALGRPLRSLCWMLRLPPPPVLAPPQPPPAAPRAESAAPQAPAFPPPPPARARPARQRRAPPSTCGPPLPA